MRPNLAIRVTFIVAAAKGLAALPGRIKMLMAWDDTSPSLSPSLSLSIPRRPLHLRREGPPVQSPTASASAPGRAAGGGGGDSMTRMDFHFPPRNRIQYPMASALM